MSKDTFEKLTAVRRLNFDFFDKQQTMNYVGDLSSKFSQPKMKNADVLSPPSRRTYDQKDLLETLRLVSPSQMFSIYSGPSAYPNVSKATFTERVYETKCTYHSECGSSLIPLLHLRLLFLLLVMLQLIVVVKLLMIVTVLCIPARKLLPPLPLSLPLTISLYLSLSLSISSLYIHHCIRPRFPYVPDAIYSADDAESPMAAAKFQSVAAARSGINPFPTGADAWSPQLPPENAMMPKRFLLQSCDADKDLLTLPVPSGFSVETTVLNPKCDRYVWLLITHSHNID